MPAAKRVKSTTAWPAPPRGVAPVDPSVAAVSRITEAAYRCFEAFGFKKTSMEAIAREAGLTRATIYNYFSNKDEIIERIRTFETDKVNIQLRSKIRKFDRFDALMTECIFHITRIAHANPYIRSFVDSQGDMSIWAHPSSSGHRQVRELWEKLLTSAASKGDLLPGLTLDEIISWLILSQEMLLTKVQSVGVSDDDLRLFIRRFVVRPLLPENP